MSYAAYDACLTRIREVLVSSYGSGRTVPSGRFTGELPEGLGDMVDARRGVDNARVEASVVGIQRSAASPMVLGNLLLDDVDFDVRIIRTITPTEQLDDASRDSLRALAAIDQSVCRQALEYPGNLLTTQAGTATGIISGMLRHVSTRVTVKGPVNGAQPVETIHRFRGIVKSAPS